jgi:hypothetical protein
MKKVIFAVIALAFSASAFADTVPAGASTVTLRDPITQQMRGLSEADTKNADTMRNFLAPAEGVGPVYEAYIKNGYLPLDAMMLANWDVTEALRTVSPGIPLNPTMKNQLELLKQQYKPAQ